jgi:cytochrome c-type biogenesis protein CcmE
MKKSHIIMILIIAVILGLMVTSLMGKSRTYATFSEASEHPHRSYDIVGKLDTTKAIVYDAIVNPDEFSFYMYDELNRSSKVIVHQPKPQDFERSTQVVASGKMEGEVFMAKSVLLKCPSKYEGQSPSIQTKEIK